MKKRNWPRQLRFYFKKCLECNAGASEVDSLLSLIYILVWGSSRDLYLNKQDKFDAYDRKNKFIFWLGKGCDAFWKATRSFPEVGLFQSLSSCTNQIIHFFYRCETSPWNMMITQEKLKSMPMQIFGGERGVLWDLCKWRIFLIKWDSRAGHHEVARKTGSWS